VPSGPFSALQRYGEARDGPKVAVDVASMRKANRGILGLWLIIILSLFPANALAQGGPPLITDDPDTPGPGYWEINLAGIFEKSRLERQLEAPLADINYGVGTRIQLKFEVPWLSVSQTGMPARTGLGNSNVGVKWRFLGQEGQRVAWSIYPQVEVNTGRSMAEKGLLNEGRQFLLPTELTLQRGRLEINGEVGRNFVQKGDDEWIFGVATEVEFDRGFELVGELHGEQSGPAAAELIVNVGGRLRMTPQITLLVAAGRGVRGPTDGRPLLRLYIGLQFNLPHKYGLSH
jgi:hypothetical protein